jgi:hypothetical protein
MKVFYKCVISPFLILALSATSTYNEYYVESCGDYYCEEEMDSCDGNPACQQSFTYCYKSILFLYELDCGGDTSALENCLQTQPQMVQSLAECLHSKGCLDSDAPCSS